MSQATFLRLLRFVGPYRRIFLLNLTATLLATVSQLLGPKFIQIGIDRYLTNASGAPAAFHGIFIVSLIYLGNLILGWWLSTAQVKSAIAVGQGAMNDLRLAVFEHIQRLSLSYFDQTHQGRIISRADTDIDSLDRVLTWGANQLLASALTLIGVLALLLQYDWRLCLAVSAVIPPLIVATRVFHKYGMKAYRELRAQSSRITGALAENIAGVRVAQAFAREEENLVRFQQLQGVYFDRFLVAARIFHTYMPFVGLVSGLGTAIVLGYGGSLVMQRQITVGELAVLSSIWACSSGRSRPWATFTMRCFRRLRAPSAFSNCSIPRPKSRTGRMPPRCRRCAATLFSIRYTSDTTPPRPGPGF